MGVVDVPAGDEPFADGPVEVGHLRTGVGHQQHPAPMPIPSGRAGRGGGCGDRCQGLGACCWGGVDADLTSGEQGVDTMPGLLGVPVRMDRLSWA